MGPFLFDFASLLPLVERAPEVPARPLKTAEDAVTAPPILAGPLGSGLGDRGAVPGKPTLLSHRAVSLPIGFPFHNP